MSLVNFSQGQKRPSNSSTVPAAPKLRDSCDACAASKVKCNKQKPSCARCIKRGVFCEYVVTKRAGRRYGPRPTETTTTVTQTGSSTSSDLANLRTPDLIHPSPGQQTVGYADLYPSILSSPGDPASWWNLTTLNPDVESLFASPLSVLQPETSNSDTTGNSPFFSSSGISSTRSGFDSNDATVLLPEDTFVAIDNVSEPAEQMSLSEIQSSLPSDVFNFQDLLSDSPGCCLLRALGLLKLLFRNTAATCTCSSGEGYSYTSCQVPTITSVIAENEKTIGVISKMLQCPCSLDGYLLAIMSLIVFKILGWYAAAAAKKTPETSMAEESQGTNKRKLDARRPSSCHSEQVIQIAAVVGSYCLEGEDQERMAAQLVLSQLHLVQRLVNELSIRLKAADDQEVARGGHLASPISATMLSQLEVDLRKRLRALSLEIVDILHRE